jgi:hypothetical protein
MKDRVYRLVNFYHRIENKAGNTIVIIRKSLAENISDKIDHNTYRMKSTSANMFRLINRSITFGQPCYILSGSFDYLGKKD